MKALYIFPIFVLGILLFSCQKDEATPEPTATDYRDKYVGTYKMEFMHISTNSMNEPIIIKDTSYYTKTIVVRKATENDKYFYYSCYCEKQMDLVVDDTKFYCSGDGFYEPKDGPYLINKIIFKGDSIFQDYSYCPPSPSYCAESTGKGIKLQ